VRYSYQPRDFALITLSVWWHRMASTTVSPLYKAVTIRRQGRASLNRSPRSTSTSLLRSVEMFSAEHSSSSPLGSMEDCNDQKLPKVVEPLHVSYETWGIFDVAYETPSIRRWKLPNLSLFEFQGEHCLWFARLLKDIWWLDRWNTTLYLLCNAWITAAPSLSLYLAYLAISHVRFLPPAL